MGHGGGGGGVWSKAATGWEASLVPAADLGPLGGHLGLEDSNLSGTQKLLQLRCGAGRPHFNTSGERAQSRCSSIVSRHSVLVRDEENMIVGMHSGSFAAFSD